MFNITEKMKSKSEGDPGVSATVEKSVSLIEEIVDKLKGVEVSRFQLAKIASILEALTLCGAIGGSVGMFYNMYGLGSASEAGDTAAALDKYTTPILNSGIVVASSVLVATISESLAKKLAVALNKFKAVLVVLESRHRSSV